MYLEDFEILNILGNRISSASYKVQHKISRKIFVLQAVEFNKSEADKKQFHKKLNVRKTINHPNILRFYDCIEQNETKIIYVMVEFCSNGCLRDIINTCVNNGTCLSEEFICKILYQTLSTLKTLEDFLGKVHMDEIFIDEDFNVKIYNFNFDIQPSRYKDKMRELGIIIFELCTLKLFEKGNFEKDLEEICNIYSSSMLSLVNHMIKDNNELKKHIDKILCHPTVLLNVSQWTKSKCFFKIPHKFISQEGSLEKLSDLENDSNRQPSVMLEKIRKREKSLQLREQKIEEKERKLCNREKKVALMERIVKDKMTQAELYLKRCRETKSTTSESSQGSRNSKKTSYDNLDTSYSADCGDSVIVPTSRKLDVTKVLKPSHFSRSLSERRVRFKGHSPLKDIDFNKRRPHVGKHKCKIENKVVCDKENHQEEVSVKMVSEDKTLSKNSRQLFAPQNVIYENDQINNPDLINEDCRPISWTEESKRYAFDLLRIMNNVSEEDKVQKEMKHTYL